MAFSLRSSIAGDLEGTFLKPLSPTGSGEMLGSVLGISFLGFAVTIALGSLLLDILGMGRLLLLASLCFLGGTGLILSTPHTAGAYDWLYAGCLISGVAWGLVETVVNPLTVTLYPTDKTHKLNVLHAWWPGGLIIGGVLGVLIGKLDFSWQIKYALVFLPALTFGILCLTTRFPATERAAAGVSTGTMAKQMGRPLFIVFFFAMFLTAASELAPGQWVDFALTRTTGMQGIWLLIYISGLMFLMRNFAGAFSHRMSPVGVLWTSCLLAAIGLVALSKANSPVTALLAATVWGTGVCFMWPTMLAAASERFPKGGALLMGLMGTAGTTSIWFFLPKMGGIYDQAKLALAAGQEPGNPAILMLTAIGHGVQAILHLGDTVVASPEATKALADLTAAAASDPTAQAKLDAILIQASQISFAAVAVLPAMLLIVFGAIWLYDRSRGGYRPEPI
jgi:Major Facilitator Superfamily